MGYRGKFGDGARVPVTTLVSEVAFVMQEHTQMAGVRPFGVALLVASAEGHGAGRLYRIEPSGTYSAWRACAIGKGSAKAEAILQEEFRESMDRESAVELVLSVILRCTPQTIISREDVEIAFVEGGTLEVETRKET